MTLHGLSYNWKEGVLREIEMNLRAKIDVYCTSAIH